MAFLFLNSFCIKEIFSLIDLISRSLCRYKSQIFYLLLSRDFQRVKKISEYFERFQRFARVSKYLKGNFEISKISNNLNMKKKFRVLEQFLFPIEKVIHNYKNKGFKCGLRYHPYQCRCFRVRFLIFLLTKAKRARKKLLSVE